MSKVVSFNEKKEKIIDRKIEDQLNDPVYMEAFTKQCADLREQLKSIHNSLGYKTKIF